MTKYNEQKYFRFFALVSVICMLVGYYSICLHLQTETLTHNLNFKILLANCEGMLKVSAINLE